VYLGYLHPNSFIKQYRPYSAIFTLLKFPPKELTKGKQLENSIVNMDFKFDLKIELKRHFEFLTHNFKYFF
jgi:hypothetical protein